MQIIKRRKKVEKVREDICFYEKRTNELRYSFPARNEKVFPCNIVNEEWIPCSESECEWWKNFEKATQNDLVCEKVEKSRETYIENAVGVCDCGVTIELKDEFCEACQCKNCGRWYDLLEAMTGVAYIYEDVLNKKREEELVEVEETLSPSKKRRCQKEVEACYI